MTLQDVLAMLQGGPLSRLPRERQGVRPDFGLRGALIQSQAKSPYERTLAPGEKRSAKDLQAMLGEVILAGGAQPSGLTGLTGRQQARAMMARRPAGASLRAAAIRQRLRTEVMPDAEFMALKDELRTLQPAPRATRPAKTAIKEHINWATVKSMQETGDPRRAGYINPTGGLLDMSGGTERRVEDHRSVGGTAAMQELMGRHGYVRWIPEGNGIDIGREPSPEQLTTIRNLARQARGEVVLDMEPGLGEYHPQNEWYADHPRKKSFEFRRGTDPDEIISAILDFYGGE